MMTNYNEHFQRYSFVKIIQFEVVH